MLTSIRRLQMLEQQLFPERFRVKVAQSSAGVTPPPPAGSVEAPSMTPPQVDASDTTSGIGTTTPSPTNASGTANAQTSRDEVLPSTPPGNTKLYPARDIYLPLPLQKNFSVLSADGDQDKLYLGTNDTSGTYYPYNPNRSYTYQDEGLYAYPEVSDDLYQKHGLEARGFQKGDVYYENGAFYMPTTGEPVQITDGHVMSPYGLMVKEPWRDVSADNYTKYRGLDKNVYIGRNDAEGGITVEPYDPKQFVRFGNTLVPGTHDAIADYPNQGLEANDILRVNHLNKNHDFVHLSGGKLVPAKEVIRTADGELVHAPITETSPAIREAASGGSGARYYYYEPSGKWYPTERTGVLNGEPDDTSGVPGVWSDQKDTTARGRGLSSRQFTPDFNNDDKLTYVFADVVEDGKHGPGRFGHALRNGDSSNLYGYNGKVFSGKLVAPVNNINNVIQLQDGTRVYYDTDGNAYPITDNSYLYNGKVLNLHLYQGEPYPGHQGALIRQGDDGTLYDISTNKNPMPFNPNKAYIDNKWMKGTWGEPSDPEYDENRHAKYHPYFTAEDSGKLYVDNGGQLIAATKIEGSGIPDDLRQRGFVGDNLSSELKPTLWKAGDNLYAKGPKGLQLIPPGAWYTAKGRVNLSLPEDIRKEYNIPSEVPAILDSDGQPIVKIQGEWKAIPKSGRFFQDKGIGEELEIGPFSGYRMDKQMVDSSGNPITYNGRENGNPGAQNTALATVTPDGLELHESLVRESDDTDGNVQIGPAFTLQNKQYQIAERDGHHYLVHNPGNGKVEAMRLNESTERTAPTERSLWSFGESSTDDIQQLDPEWQTAMTHVPPQHEIIPTTPSLDESYEGYRNELLEDKNFRKSLLLGGGLGLGAGVLGGLATGNMSHAIPITLGGLGLGGLYGYSGHSDKKKKMEELGYDKFSGEVIDALVERGKNQKDAQASFKKRADGPAPFPVTPTTPSTSPEIPAPVYKEVPNNYADSMWGDGGFQKSVALGGGIGLGTGLLASMFTKNRKTILPFTLGGLAAGGLYGYSDYEGRKAEAEKIREENRNAEALYRWQQETREKQRQDAAAADLLGAGTGSNKKQTKTHAPQRVGWYGPDSVVSGPNGEGIGIESADVDYDENGNLIQKVTYLRDKYPAEKYDVLGSGKPAYTTHSGINVYALRNKDTNETIYTDAAGHRRPGPNDTMTQTLYGAIPYLATTGYTLGNDNATKRIEFIGPEDPWYWSSHGEERLRYRVYTGETDGKGRPIFYDLQAVRNDEDTTRGIKGFTDNVNNYIWHKYDGHGTNLPAGRLAAIDVPHADVEALFKGHTVPDGADVWSLDPNNQKTLEVYQAFQRSDFK